MTAPDLRPYAYCWQALRERWAFSALDGHVFTGNNRIDVERWDHLTMARVVYSRQQAKEILQQHADPDNRVMLYQVSCGSGRMRIVLLSVFKPCNDPQAPFLVQWPTSETQPLQAASNDYADIRQACLALLQCKGPRCIPQEQFALLSELAVQI